MSNKDDKPKELEGEVLPEKAKPLKLKDISVIMARHDEEIANMTKSLGGVARTLTYMGERLGEVLEQQNPPAKTNTIPNSNPNPPPPNANAQANSQQTVTSGPTGQEGKPGDGLPEKKELHPVLELGLNYLARKVQSDLFGGGTELATNMKALQERAYGEFQLSYIMSQRMHMRENFKAGRISERDLKMYDDMTGLLWQKTRLDPNYVPPTNVPPSSSTPSVNVNPGVSTNGPKPTTEHPTKS